MSVSEGGVMLKYREGYEEANREEYFYLHRILLY